MTNVTQQRIAWSLPELSSALGVSLGFLRNEVKRGVLPVRRLGRRVLVLDEDLRGYLKGNRDREILALH